MVPDSPIIPVGLTQAAMVKPFHASSLAPSFASRYVVDCACHDWLATPCAYCSVPEGTGAADRFPSASNVFPSKRHHALRLSSGAMHAPVPTTYSTVFVPELPARSVAITVNRWRPGVVSRGADP